MRLPSPPPPSLSLSGTQMEQLLLPCHSWKVKCPSLLPALYTDYQLYMNVSVGYVDNFSFSFSFIFFTVAFKQYRNLSNEVEDRPQLLSAFVIVCSWRNQSNCRAAAAATTAPTTTTTTKSDNNSHLSPCASSDTMECTSRCENLSISISLYLSRCTAG